MARETTLPCPSGLVVRFRSIKGKDLDNLRDKRRVASGEAISDLLDACTLEFLERGVYTREPTFKWLDALVGDQMSAFIGLRQATLGDTFDFNVRCRDRDCKEMIRWTLDLRELPRKQLPQASAANFLETNTFTTEINDTEVTFKLRTGRDAMLSSRHISKLRLQKGKEETEAKTLLGLALRITGIAGVADSDKLAWLEELDLPDIKNLVKAMDAVDCGIETTILVSCDGPNGCGLNQEVELPLDEKFFKEFMM